MYTSCLKRISTAVILPWLLVLPLIATAQNLHMDEKGFVTINGLEQWVTIKGERSKPVILFLHGGPGSTFSPYADALLKGWEDDFILVQWDQRGAGKTFGRTAPDELSPAYLAAHPLTVEEMIKDGIAVAEYLVGHLGKQRIILFGTSWGSVLGIQLAQQRPDLFWAYIGHSQVVYPSDLLGLAYQKVYQLAQKAGDQKSLAILHSIGKPPYDTARQTGQLMRVIKTYERLRSQPAPEEWFTAAAGYDSKEDDQHRAGGDDYSFVHFAGDKRLGVKPMTRPLSSLSFTIPVYFLQGAEDILTPREVTKPYFDKITAPKKEYLLLPQTAHGFNEAVVSALYKVCKKIKP